jgi:hypothetical protein
MPQFLHRLLVGFNISFTDLRYSDLLARFPHLEQIISILGNDKNPKLRRSDKLSKVLSKRHDKVNKFE